MIKLWDNVKIEKTFNNKKEMYDFIKIYLEEKKFNSHYYRLNYLEDGTVWLDYGSYTHFFYFTEVEDD